MECQRSELDPEVRGQDDGGAEDGPDEVQVARGQVKTQRVYEVHVNFRILNSLGIF